MKAVFLVANYVPHQLILFKELLEKYKLDIVSFSISENFTYIPANTDGLTTYKKSDFSKREILEKIISLQPQIVVVAGWMNKDYVWIAKRAKRILKIPIVSYSDTQWHGTRSQILNSIISPLYLKKAFSHLWISGVFQYEYARKLGFNKSQILFNSLSCDVDLFHTLDLGTKAIKYPKSFLYIGRFVKAKGLNYLADAWGRIQEKKGWSLTLIGDGPLKDDFKGRDGIIVKDYMPQQELLHEMNCAGCFVLPSIAEPWALVIHEAVSTGLPVVCTEVCGAAPHFVVDSFNGYKVKSECVDSLQSAMETIISLDDKDLLRYSYNSRRMSAKISINSPILIYTAIAVTNEGNIFIDSLSALSASAAD